MTSTTRFLAALAAVAAIGGAAARAPAATPPSRDVSATEADMPAVLGDLARYFVPEPAYRPSAGTDRLAVALGLAPPLQMGGEDTDVGALRLALVSRHHNVSGLDLSLLSGRARGKAAGVQLSAFNFAEGPLSGVQLGLLANVAGTAPQSGSGGVQLALGANWSDSFDGVQLAAVFNRAGKGSVAQVAVASNSSEEFSGLQLAAVNLRGKRFHGVQAGFLNGGADVFSGLQLGVFANSAVPLGTAVHDAKMDGWQVALLANAADTVKGGQVALVNLAADVDGIQFGIYNQARRLRGVQVGLLNHCDSSDVPFLPLVRAAF